MTGEEFLQSKDIWHHPRVSTRRRDVSYDIAELLDEFLEAHTEQNSHKQVVMQAEGSDEMCGSDCCPNDGACEHCQNPIRKSAEGAAVGNSAVGKGVRCGKCEALGHLAPCDECYLNGKIDSGD